MVLISEYTLVSTFHWREEPERKKERNIYGILTVATILCGRHHHLHWLMRELIRGFPRSCISRSHLHGEQYKVRNGFSILWLKSPLLLLLLCFPEKMWEEEHCVEEKNCRPETYFTPKEIAGKKKVKSILLPLSQEWKSQFLIIWVRLTGG